MSARSEEPIAVPRGVLRALVDDAITTVVDAERRRQAAGMPLPAPHTEQLRDAVLVAGTLLVDATDPAEEKEEPCPR